jgi:hypothetical protein
MAFNSLQIEEDEGFGPGTDLAFKLFAIVLLAATLGFVSFSLEETARRKTSGQARRVEAIDLGNEALFEVGTAKLLNEPTKETFAKQIRMIRDAMGNGTINQILIEGFASAEGDIAVNLDLSRQRCAKILELLKRGLPYPGQCFISTAYGNANSAVYRDLQNQKKKAIVALTKQEIKDNAKRLEQERAVKVVGMFDPNSACLYVESPSGPDTTKGTR